LRIIAATYQTRAVTPIHDHAGFQTRPPGVETGRYPAEAKVAAGGNHDPLILGLFQKLPEPDADWPAKDRLKWLQSAANIFDLVYKGEGDRSQLARAERSPRHDE
jgi:hypothetical protein